MASYVKKGDTVIVLLPPNKDKDSAQNLVSELQKVLGTTGEMLIVDSTNLKSTSYDSSSADIILSGFTNCYIHNDDVLKESLRILKPNGILAVREPTESSDSLNLITKLKLNGFLLKTSEPKNVTMEEGKNAYEIIAEKPSFEIGSSVKLSFAKPAEKVWKLDDDDDDELIDEDDLLDEADKLKPEPTSLKVCGTTGKRKACKDCSCGLAEELSGETGAKELPRSACGSCYLGDAFRCASCPYIGMPAFKPGEKIVLPDQQLTADS